jgi:hypothetical protein
MPSSTTKDPDPYGRKGTIPEALWSTKWGGWSHKRQDEYFASVATWGPLSIEQCCLLLQGQPPMPSGWDELVSCLGEYESLVARFKADVKRGALAPNPTADELAAWCDCMHAQLPVALVLALREKSAGELPPTMAPQSSKPLVLASWIPLNLSETPNPTPSKPVRGRPSTAKPTYDAMVREGKEVLMASAKQGDDMKLGDIAEHIIEKGLAPGMQKSSIVSRLKSKLPFEKAQMTAAMAKSRR